MITIPESERMAFETFLINQGRRLTLTPEEYLRKVWYHEQAARIGEYMAMVLLDLLLPLVPAVTIEDVESEVEEKVEA